MMQEKRKDEPVPVTEDHAGKKKNKADKTDLPPIGYEYLDHTADIQLHGWGPTVSNAFEQGALAMFNYISELDNYEVIPEQNVSVSVEGHDMQSLLFNFLDEFLCAFNCDRMICKEVKILEFDKTAFKIKAEGRGEKFSKAKHTGGTEIKAITYSAMEIYEEDGQAHVLVIVDI